MKKDFRYFNVIILFLIIFSYMINPSKVVKENYNYVLDTSYISEVKVVLKNQERFDEESNVVDVFYGTITAYVSYCEGCIGITASGYDVRNTIYYEDSNYGKLRIIAADKSIPFGTIVKISNIGEEIIAIVLDRGGAIGFNNFSQADLLCVNEYVSFDFGKKNNAKFEVLRYGF